MCARGSQRSVLGVVPQMLPILFLNTTYLAGLEPVEKVNSQEIPGIFQCLSYRTSWTNKHFHHVWYLIYVLDVEYRASILLANLSHQSPGIRPLFLWLQSPPHMNVFLYPILWALTCENLYVIFIKYFNIMIM